MANPVSTNPAAAFGEATRLSDMRRRLLFLLGSLIVFRIGTFIPVPGIDPTALAACSDDTPGFSRPNTLSAEKARRLRGMFRSALARNGHASTGM